MTEEKALIEIRKLSKAYGFLPVLKNISLDVQRGQFIALLGPNGSGKSTLLKMIGGLAKPTAGTISVGGWDMPREAEAVRSQIGMVSHKALLYDNLTARENLVFFSRLYGITDMMMLDALLDQVGLGKRAHSLVRTFSRGMQQRLSIARALLHNPDVLLFDEPYTGLDQDASEVLDDLLLTAQDGGRTVLMATHQLDRAVKLADRIIIISKGQIGHDGATSDLEMGAIHSLYTDITGATTAR